MGFQSDGHLSFDQLVEVLKNFDASQQVSVVQIRPHIKGEIRKSVEMTGETLSELVLSAFETGHQSGGDMEVIIPDTAKKLVGHHDGIYWLEDVITG